jgi:hypothetical protein
MKKYFVIFFVMLFFAKLVSATPPKPQNAPNNTPTPTKTTTGNTTAPAVSVSNNMTTTALKVSPALNIVAIPTQVTQVNNSVAYTENTKASSMAHADLTMPSPTPGTSNPIAGPIAVGVWPSGNMQVFGIGARNGLIYYKAYTGSAWTPWTPIGTNIFAYSPTVAVNYLGDLELFDVSTTPCAGSGGGTVFYATSTNYSSWSAWNELGGSNITSNITLLDYGSAGMEAFASDVSGTVRGNKFTPSTGWTYENCKMWSCLGMHNVFNANKSVTPAACFNGIDPNTKQIFCVDSNSGQVANNWYTSSGWKYNDCKSNWTLMGGPTMSLNNSTIDWYCIAGATDGLNQPEVFAIDSSSNVWYRIYSPTLGWQTWTNLGFPGGGGTGGPYIKLGPNSTVLNSNGCLALFVCNDTGASGTVYCSVQSTPGGAFGPFNIVGWPIGAQYVSAGIMNGQTILWASSNDTPYTITGTFSGGTYTWGSWSAAIP